MCVKFLASEMEIRMFSLLLLTPIRLGLENHTSGRKSVVICVGRSGRTKMSGLVKLLCPLLFLYEPRHESRGDSFGAFKGRSQIQRGVDLVRSLWCIGWPRCHDARAHTLL